MFELILTEGCIMVVFLGDKEQCRVPVSYENGCFVAGEGFSVSEPALSRYEIQDENGNVLLYDNEPLVDCKIGVVL